MRERRLLLEAEERGKVIFADILAINPDFRGMIEIPGLIDAQPYVHSQTSDGSDYLSTDFNGNRNRHGTIFLSSLNSRLLMDNNTVFYGHHLDTGGMFARLMRYKEAETFKRAPVIVLDGLIGESKWIIFSAHVSEPEPWYSNPVLSMSAYADYIEELQARSLFTTDVEVTANDRIITLSVCDYTYEDMRFLVHARRLRHGEQVPTEVIAEKNLNRKDFQVSNLQPVGAIRSTSTAVAQTPDSGRIYYYQMQNGFIQRYSGNMGDAQGPFRALTHSGISERSFAAAHIRNVAYDYDGGGGARTLYLAIQAVGGEVGINLYTSGLAQGMIRHDGLVTPPGVNARFPALQGAGNENVWLLYSVPGDISSLIYRVLLVDERASGAPELLYTVKGVTDARPLGYFNIAGESLIVWHEAANGFIRSAKPGGDAVYSINDGIEADARVIIFGDRSGHDMRVAVEVKGRMFFTSIDTSSRRVVSTLPDAILPEEDDDPDPDGDDDGTDEDPPEDPAPENPPEDPTPEDPPEDPPSGGDEE